MIRNISRIQNKVGVPLLPRCSFSSYFKSPLVGPPSMYTDVEKSNDPKEWKWVEQLIPPPTVPDRPKEKGKVFPSGWTTPTSSEDKRDCPYFIPRTKNHMVPVYTLIWERGQVRETRIKHVEGNIWQLEKDVGSFLKSQFPPDKIISTYTNEMTRFVGIKGDYTELIKEWLMRRGF